MKKFFVLPVLLLVLLFPVGASAHGVPEQHNKHCWPVIGCTVHGCHVIMVVCPHGHRK